MGESGGEPEFKKKKKFRGYNNLGTRREKERDASEEPPRNSTLGKDGWGLTRLVAERTPFRGADIPVCRSRRQRKADANVCPTGERRFVGQTFLMHRSVIGDPAIIFPITKSDSTATPSQRLG
jgi:hypothetical protein